MSLCPRCKKAEGTAIHPLRVKNDAGYVLLCRLCYGVECEREDELAGERARAEFRRMWGPRRRGYHDLGDR